MLHADAARDARLWWGDNSLQLSMRSYAREIDTFLALSCQQYRKINVSYGTFQTFSLLARTSSLSSESLRTKL